MTKARDYRRKRRHLAQGGTDYLRAYYERRERVRADRGAGLYIEPLAGKTLHIPADSGNSHKPEFNKYYGNENCGSGAAEKRRFKQFETLTQETIAGSQVEYSNQVCANLGTEVKARAQAGKLGYDILINEREKKYGFYLYKGKDLTAKTTRVTRPAYFPEILTM